MEPEQGPQGSEPELEQELGQVPVLVLEHEDAHGHMVT